MFQTFQFQNRPLDGAKSCPTGTTKCNQICFAMWTWKFGLWTLKVNFALHVDLKSILCKNQANVQNSKATSKGSMSLNHS